MEEIQFRFDDSGHGRFFARQEGEEIGEMEVSISEKNLTVYHTEVSPKAEGTGLAKKMLAAMVSYAREHSLQVTALCPYVHLQFKRHPDEYSDVWKQNA